MNWIKRLFRKECVLADDWQPVIKHWQEENVCPCGCGSMSSPVCPWCGHRTEVKVVRWEWEESPSRILAGVPSRRSYRLVMWTPDHCKRRAA